MRTTTYRNMRNGVGNVREPRGGLNRTTRRRPHHDVRCVVVHCTQPAADQESIHGRARVARPWVTRDEFFRMCLDETEAAAPMDEPAPDTGSSRSCAAHELLPVVYAELRRLAAARLAALRPGQTLQPTALVHEAYMRLVRGSDPGWNGRGHFFGAAARAMRNILVDHARRKGRAVHGGGLSRASLDDLPAASQAESDRTLLLDGLLTRLDGMDPRQADIANLYIFVGMSHEEIAESLEISVRTVEREWRFVRAWLRAELEREHGRSNG